MNPNQVKMGAVVIVIAAAVAWLFAGFVAGLITAALTAVAVVMSINKAVNARNVLIFAGIIAAVALLGWGLEGVLWCSAIAVPVCLVLCFFGVLLELFL